MPAFVIKRARTTLRQSLLWVAGLAVSGLMVSGGSLGYRVLGAFLGLTSFYFVVATVVLSRTDSYYLLTADQLLLRSAIGGASVAWDAVRGFSPRVRNGRVISYGVQADRSAISASGSVKWLQGGTWGPILIHPQSVSGGRGYLIPLLDWCRDPRNRSLIGTTPGLEAFRAHFLTLKPGATK